jgi:hypothetical protein
MFDIHAIRFLARFANTTGSGAIPCLECLAQLERFAAIVLAGEDAAQVMPAVGRHFEDCDRCRAALAARYADPAGRHADHR